MRSLIKTGFAEANYFLGGLPFAASTQRKPANRTAEISSVPSIVKHSRGTAEQDRRNRGALWPKRQDGAKRPNRDPPLLHRADMMQGRSGAADAGGNTVVRTQGEARGPLTKAISDVTKAASSGKPDKVAAEVANAPRSIVKSLSDTAKKVVKT